jgi:hypothetical protein
MGILAMNVNSKEQPLNHEQTNKKCSEKKEYKE